MQAFEVVGRYVLDGADAAAAKVKSVGSSAETSATKINKSTKSFDGLGNSIKNLSSKMRIFATVGIAAVAGGIFGMARSATQTAREIQTMAQVSGTSTTEFQKNAFAAASVGIESEKLSDIYKDINDRVGDFLTTGGGPMADFFEKIAPKVGVTAAMFKDLSGPDALQLFVSTLERAGVNGQEMTFFMESMAGDAARLIPLLQNGGKSMKEMGAQALASGLIMDESLIKTTAEADQKFKIFGMAIDSAKVKIGAALLPALERLMPVIVDQLIPGIVGAAEAFINLITFIVQVPGPFQEIALALAAVSFAMGPVLSVMTLLGSVFKLASVGVTALSGAFGFLSVSILPFTLVVLGIAAAIAAVVFAFKNWDAIVAITGTMITGLLNIITGFASYLVTGFAEVVALVIGYFSQLPAGIMAAGQQIAVDAMQWASEAVQTVVGWFGKLPGMVVAAISGLPGAVWSVLGSMASGMMSIVQNAVSNVIASFRHMFMEIVGNSIVPDMRVGVDNEMQGMADESVRSSAILARGVTGNFDDVASSSSGMSGGYSGSGGSSAGGQTYVDMRHSTFNDDRDLQDRLKRSGAQTTGG